MSSVIQALKDIENAIKAQGGGSGGGSDDGDEEESNYPILIVHLSNSGDEYFIDSDYQSIYYASHVNQQLVILAHDEGQTSMRYYEVCYGRKPMIEEEGTAPDYEDVVVSVDYVEFRAIPDEDGTEYVRVYNDEYSYLPDFVAVEHGRYAAGPLVIECELTDSADASYPTVYPCSYTEGHEADYRGIAEAISAGRDVVVLLHTNGNVSAGVESSDVYLPLESPTPTGMDEDAYWFQRVLSHRYGQDGTGVGNLTSVNVRLDGNGPYANIYQISQS